MLLVVLLAASRASWFALAGASVIVGAALLVANRAQLTRYTEDRRWRRIGLIALQDAGVTVNVDVVRSEFEKLVRQTESVNEKAAHTLEQTLRLNFADGDGRLPRTLEQFLGDRGALRSMVDELFDETRRDSAIGRIGTMLERYFDGDASKLAILLDPTRLHSPMFQFREEISGGFKALEERLVAIEAAAAARGAERARSAAKGADFEAVLDDLLGDLALEQVGRAHESSYKRGLRSFVDFNRRTDLLDAAVIENG